MAHWKELYDQKYLGGYSLYNDATSTYGELTVTIERVVEEDVAAEGGRSSKCPVAHLVGQKPMVLNKTNCKTIAKLYGVDTKGWAGKSVTVYFDNSVKFAGEQTGGLRIRKVIPQTAVACADCGQVISAAFKKTAAQLADYSKKHYGRPLCGECLKKLIDADKAKEDGNGSNG